MAARVVWAIDIGQTSVRAVKAAAAGERIEILAFDSVPYKDILSAPGVDRDNEIQLALRTLVSRNSFSSEAIAAAIPGQSALVRFIKLPPVEKKRIPDIVRYEAHQQIPFPLEEVVWAYKPMEKPGTHEGEQVEVGIFAMRRDIVNRFLSNLIVCDIDVDILQLAPMALYNMLSFDQPPGDEATLLLDVGAENTELLLATEHSVWPRSLPVAGNDMTQAIMEKFKVPFDKAETLKRMAKQSKYSVQIYHAIEPVLKRFVEEIQRSLGFYRSINPGVRISGILTLGGAFRLPGMAKYLSENLRLPVRSYTEVQNFDISRARNLKMFEEDAMGFGVALGLAVQGLGYGPMDTSLLPPEVLHRKLISKKKPYAAAVAAMAVVSLGSAMFSTYQEREALKEAYPDSAVTLQKDLLQKRGEYKRLVMVEERKLKLEQACQLWEGRDQVLSVLKKVFGQVPAEPDNKEGVWLIKVVTQRIPFELAAQKIATGRSQELGSGLKGRADNWEDDPKFPDTLAQLARAVEMMAMTRIPTMPGRPATPATTGPKKEYALRVVVVGETTESRRDKYVDSSFLEPLKQSGEAPKFIDGQMLWRENEQKWLGPDGRPVTLDSQTGTKWKEIASAEDKKASNLALTPADEEALRGKQAFLDTLKNQRGIHPQDFLQFTASFFVDADGSLRTRVKELKKE